MRQPQAILQEAHNQAQVAADQSLVDDLGIQERLEYLCNCQQNRSAIRLLMACLLAKLTEPHLDLRKPYTEITGDDAFSGRHYDEDYLAPFIDEHRLPLNRTTAFLTPAWRNQNRTLVRGLKLEGRPPELYRHTLMLLDDVFAKRVAPESLLAEAIRLLIKLRDSQASRLQARLQSLQNGPVRSLSAAAIVALIKKHLACPGASRLPVLVVAAAYQVAEQHLAQRMRPLRDHHAADLQTGALGDLEVYLNDQRSRVTVYEMKHKKVTRLDIDDALHKLGRAGRKIDQYIFVSTDPPDLAVNDYAASIYQKTAGIEFAIFDCIGFLRHFLQLFHWLRDDYLNTYREWVMQEPASAVGQRLKETLLELCETAAAEVAAMEVGGRAHDQAHH